MSSRPPGLPPGLAGVTPSPYAQPVPSRPTVRMPYMTYPAAQQSSPTPHHSAAMSQFSEDFPQTAANSRVVSTPPVPPAPVVQIPYMRMLANQRAREAARNSRSPEQVSSNASAASCESVGIAPFPPANRAGAPTPKFQGQTNLQHEGNVQNTQERMHPYKVYSKFGPVEVKNIFDLPRGYRKGLLSSELLEVYIGPELVYRIPKHLMLTVSYKAQEAVQNGSNKIVIPIGAIDKNPVQTLLEWLVKLTQASRATRMRAGNDIHENLSIVRAAYLLGMQHVVDNIPKSYYGSIADGIPEYEDCAAIDEHALSTEDLLFQHLANRLSYLRHMKQIPDPEDFDEFLQEHPRLAQAMADIDYQHEKGRKVSAQIARRHRARKARGEGEQPGRRRRRQERRGRDGVDRLEEARNGLCVLSISDEKIFPGLGGRR